MTTTSKSDHKGLFDYLQFGKAPNLRPDGSNRNQLEAGEAAGLIIVGTFATMVAAVAAVATALFRRRYRITRR